MKKEKIIDTKHIHLWRNLKKCTWLIPLVYLAGSVDKVLLVLQGSTAAGRGPAAIDAAGILLSCLLRALPLALIWWAISGEMLKNAVQRSRFRSVQDIEYYRDTCPGLPPGEVSLLMDLRVEEEKDAAATLLGLELKGSLEFSGDGAVVRGKEDGSLSPADRVLLDILGQPGAMGKEGLKERLRPWKKAVIEEALQTPYFKKPEWNWKKPRLTGCLVPFVCLFLIAAAFLSPPFQYTLETVHAEGMTEEGFRQMVCTDPLLMTGLLLAATIFLLVVLMLVSPLMLVLKGVVRAQSMENTKVLRTKAGEGQMEYLYGIKNFIHDFSQLSEATKEQLVLWDDFLVYAVVLEENEQILDEIFRKRKINRKEWKRRYLQI